MSTRNIEDRKVLILPESDECSLDERCINEIIEVHYKDGWVLATVQPSNHRVYLFFRRTRLNEGNGAE